MAQHLLCFMFFHIIFYYYGPLYLRTSFDIIMFFFLVFVVVIFYSIFCLSIKFVPIPLILLTLREKVQNHETLKLNSPSFITNSWRNHSVQPIHKKENHPNESNVSKLVKHEWKSTNKTFFSFPMQDISSKLLFVLFDTISKLF